ncbi:NifB/NifX family molybdenum-iron cluster-binding protein [Desulfohalovibrio reitneri]|uniref:NifB/NifX family molybdenum-iron cluster-binding protein n=1 Tax=Desulfohalovibrio reitneri TaxID=1307759 RepID=UPI0004A72FF4|nr:NifB/NifX family molybdenum-iron cluster-binding protein [Desulfohalovibrio reitneri]
MRIAIPTAEGVLCAHFGHCREFALMDVDPEAKTVASCTFETPPPHEPGVLPAWLADKGVEVVIAGGMGQRARDLLDQRGVKTVVGAQGGKPEEVAASWLGGTLEVGANLCDH